MMDIYIMCINNSGCEDELTVYEIYLILPGCAIDYGFAYRIMNDKGIAAEYNVKRFKEVNEVF